MRRITLHKSKMGKVFVYALAELRDTTVKFGKSGRIYDAHLGTFSRSGTFSRVTGHKDSAQEIGTCDGTPAQEKALLEKHFQRPIMGCRTFRREGIAHGFLEVTFQPETAVKVSEATLTKREVERLERLRLSGLAGLKVPLEGSRIRLEDVRKDPRAEVEKVRQEGLSVLRKAPVVSDAHMEAVKHLTERMGVRK